MAHVLANAIPPVMYQCEAGGSDGAQLHWVPFTLEQSMAINIAKSEGMHHVEWFATRTHPTEKGPDGQPLTMRWKYYIDINAHTQRNETTGAIREFRPCDDTWDDIAANEIEAIHVTRQCNVASIMEHGLDPKRGGRGGAGEAYSSVDSLGAQHFIDHSRNRIHVTAVHPVDGSLGRANESDKSQFYANFYKSMGHQPVSLHVYAVGVQFEPDPDDPTRGRQRTTQAIGAACVSQSSYEDLPDDNAKKVKIRAALAQAEEGLVNKIKAQLETSRTVTARLNGA